MATNGRTILVCQRGQKPSNTGNAKRSLEHLRKGLTSVMVRTEIDSIYENEQTEIKCIEEEKGTTVTDEKVKNMSGAGQNARNSQA